MNDDDEVGVGIGCKDEAEGTFDWGEIKVEETE